MAPGEFTSERVYWQSHMLECCWRCMTSQVDPDDELGLCPDCRGSFSESSLDPRRVPAKRRAPSVRGRASGRSSA